MDQLDFSASPPYTKDSAVYTEKISIECTMNDDSVRTPRKNPSTSTNFSLPIISVEKLWRWSLFVKRFAIFEIAKPGLSLVVF